MSLLDLAKFLRGLFSLGLILLNCEKSRIARVIFQAKIRFFQTSFRNGIVENYFPDFSISPMSRCRRFDKCRIIILNVMPCLPTKFVFIPIFFGTNFCTFYSLEQIKPDRSVLVLLFCLWNMTWSSNKKKWEKAHCKRMTPHTRAHTVAEWKLMKGNMIFCVVDCWCGCCYCVCVFVRTRIWNQNSLNKP